MDFIMVWTLECGNWGGTDFFYNFSSTIVRPIILNYMVADNHLKIKTSNHNCKEVNRRYMSGIICLTLVSDICLQDCDTFQILPTATSQPGE